MSPKGSAAAKAAAAASCGALVSVDDAARPPPSMAVDSGAIVSGTAGPGSALAQCCYDCGPPRPVSEMMKTNARALPVCHPCYNARRAIVSAVSKDPAAKQALADMQSKDPELWKAKVRSCRIIDINSPGHEGQGCITNARQRAKQVATVVTTLKQTIRMTESGGVSWYNQAEFLTHQVSTQRKTEEDAMALWKKMVSDPAVTKMRLPGDEPRVPVMLAPQTSYARERSLETQVGVSSHIETPTQAEDALGQLSSLGVGPATLSSPVFAGMGGVFRPGAAAGSSSGQPTSMDELAAVGVDAIVPQHMFQGAVPPAKRELVVRPSDPERGEGVVGGGPKGGQQGKRRCHALQGVTGQLLILRNEGMELTQKIWMTYGKTGKNVSKAIRDSVSKAGPDVELDPESQRTVEGYEQALIRSREIVVQIKAWTIEDGEAGVSELFSLLDTLEDLGGQLTKKLEELRADAGVRRKALAAARNVVAKERQKNTTMYKGSVPDNVLRYLYEHGAFGGQYKQGIEVENKDKDWIDNCHVVSKGEVSFKPDKPAYFPPSDGQAGVKDVGRRVQTIPENLGQERLTQAELSCKNFMASNNFAAAKVSVEPKGAPFDKLEGFD